MTQNINVFFRLAISLQVRPERSETHVLEEPLKNLASDLA
jgi:hypothetical protein